MTALSDDLEAFLEAERDIDVPALSERERLFRRLQPLLVVPVTLAAAGAATSAAASADSASSAVLGGALKAKLAAAVVSAALFGGAVGATGHAYLTSPPVQPSIARGAAPSAALPRAPKPAEPAPAEPAPAEPAGGLFPPPSAAAAPSLAAPRPERPRPSGSLRAERLLIETASAALLRSDPESAILALRQHARRFPQGDLAEEREVLLAKARAASRSATPAGEPGASHGTSP
jgi:hypothetical protein